MPELACAIFAILDFRNGPRPEKHDPLIV
jgi:hypothetical protein